MRFSQEVGRAFFTRGRPCVRGLTCPFCNALWRVSVSFDCLACSFWASRLNYQTFSAEKVLKTDLTITRQNILQCINSSGNSRTWALQRYLCTVKIDDEMVQPPEFVCPLFANLAKCYDQNLFCEWGRISHRLAAACRVFEREIT